MGCSSLSRHQTGTLMTSAERMMALFAGHSGAHGTHGEPTRNPAKGGKLEIKKTALTVREPATADIWQQHLDGVRPLGIIPIRKDHSCIWGCIDVDQYDTDHASLLKKIRGQKLPLVVCRSKSGGAHCFLFLKTPISAEDMQDILRDMAARLGIGNCEIFPKQKQTLEERGDLGNWLNMPYFNGDQTDRYGIKDTMAAMTLSEFLSHAERRRVTTSDLDAVAPPAPSDDSLSDGPPCLQHLAAMGFPEGTRNNGLFALGVFCRKKYPSTWKSKLEEYNREYMSPPLPAEEVLEVQKNLERKEYNYTCSDVPLVTHCNAVLCRSRKYGVTGSGEYPVIAGMTKLEMGKEAFWFLDIEGERLELDTQQLQNYREFHKVCMEQMTVCYSLLKQDTWITMVQTAMRDAQVVEAPRDSGTEGHLMELLEDYCTNRNVSTEKEGLLLGKPWQDEESGRYYFRLTFFMSFLKREGFAEWGRNKVGSYVKNLGGSEFFNIKGKGVNVRWVPALFEKQPVVTTPELEEHKV